jgi:hypothetical protein
VIHVYAFAEAAAAAAAAVGAAGAIDGAAVELLELDDVVVAISHHDRAPAASEESVVRHASVVEALARGGAAVLPARFGLAYPDEAALAAAVAARAGDLRAGLDRVRGRVELGLRVLGAEERDEEPGDVTGGEYLRARLRAAARRERVAADVHGSLEPVAAEATRSGGPGGRLLLNAAYLVDAPAVERFQRAVHDLQAAHPELSFVCTGPWPPYSFAPEGNGTA